MAISRVTKDHPDTIRNLFDEATDSIKIVLPFVTGYVGAPLVGCMEQNPTLDVKMITRFYREDFIKDVSDIDELIRCLSMAKRLLASWCALTQKAANGAFSEFLSDAALDSRQIHFVKQIANYIVKNGMMGDFSILQESPFADYGRVSELFDIQSFAKLRTVIETINENATT